MQIKRKLEEMINNFLLIFKELNIENKNIKIFGNNAIPPYREIRLLNLYLMSQRKLK